MAWRPYSNLINGELDNRVPGKVTGWIRFFRQGKKPLKVRLDLSGDFHEDIRGKVIRLKNAKPSDESLRLDLDSTYMEGMSVKQHGSAGDITAGLSLGPWTPALAQKLATQNELIWDEEGLQGLAREERRQHFAGVYQKHVDAGDLFYCYTDYPYIEWFSESNGRVVLELEPGQLDVLDQAAVLKEKTAAELAQGERSRTDAMSTFMSGMEFSKDNREKGGDGNVFGVVVR